MIVGRDGHESGLPLRNASFEACVPQGKSGLVPIPGKLPTQHVPPEAHATQKLVLREVLYSLPQRKLGTTTRNY